MKLSPWLVLVSLSFSSAVWADNTAPSFKTDVLPIFKTYCSECHSGWFPDAGLDLEDHADIMQGTRNGPTVVPGKPDKGWLIYSLTTTKGRQYMPPKGEGVRPPANDIETIKQWIKAGAKP